MSKKYIVSVGFYRVYNVNVQASNATQAEAEIYAHLDEHGLQAVLDMGQPCPVYTGQDVLIQCEGELQ